MVGIRGHLFTASGLAIRKLKVCPKLTLESLTVCQAKNPNYFLISKTFDKEQPQHFLMEFCLLSGPSIFFIIFNGLNNTCQGNLQSYGWRAQRLEKT